VRPTAAEALAAAGVAAAAEVERDAPAAATAVAAPSRTLRRRLLIGDGMVMFFFL
jgi:hypothetical protein